MQVTEVTIKSYSRRGKDGKQHTVRGYTRRVGRKGHISPKRSQSSAMPGDELKIVASKKKYTVPQMTREQVAAWDLAAKGDNLSSGYRKQQKYKGSSSVLKSRSSVKNPLSPQGTSTILQKIDKKIEDFINKYDPKARK